VGRADGKSVRRLHDRAAEPGRERGCEDRAPGERARRSETGSGRGRDGESREDHRRSLGPTAKRFCSSLTKALAGVLAEYLKAHPGGQFLFCHFGEVERSKKRSRTTGHRDEKDRPSGLKGRLSTVREREAPPLAQLTPKETHDHLKRSLAGSAWSVVKGWHSLRHAFIGICASSGIDQRFIDEWVGHQTEEQRRRYRHLAPSVQKAALSSAFD
jgi:integrase